MIRFGSGNIPQGYVVDPAGNTIKGPLRLFWPPGYQVDTGPGGPTIHSRDKFVQIRDGDTLEDVSICPMADGRQLIWDPGHLLAP